MTLHEPLESVQELELNVPGAPVLHTTVPVGADPVTVAMHVVELPTSGEVGEHDTVVNEVKREPAVQ